MAEAEGPPSVSRIATEDLRKTSGYFKRASTGQIRAVRTIGAMLTGSSGEVVVPAEEEDAVAPLPNISSPRSPLSPHSPRSPGYAQRPAIGRSESVTVITSINKRVKFGEAGQVPWMDKTPPGQRTPPLGRRFSRKSSVSSACSSTSLQPMTPTATPDDFVRLVFVGAPGVGKTNLISRATEDFFSLYPAVTKSLECSVMHFNVPLEEEKDEDAEIEVKFWDTPSNGLDFLTGGDAENTHMDSDEIKAEKESLRACLAVADALVFVFDACNISSFTRIIRFCQNLSVDAQDPTKLAVLVRKAPRFLLGNKADLVDDEDKIWSKAERWADRLGMPFFKTTATTTREDVAGPLEKIVQATLRRRRAIRASISGPRQ